MGASRVHRQQLFLATCEPALTKPLPFTAASTARLIRGAEAAGKRVVGVKPDGTLIFGDSSPELAPANAAIDEHDPYVAAAERGSNAKAPRTRHARS